MPFEWFKGILLENGKRYEKSDNTIEKGFKEKIQNHILHVRFEHIISARAREKDNLKSREVKHLKECALAITPNLILIQAS